MTEAATAEKIVDRNILSSWLNLPESYKRKKLALNDCIYFGEQYIKPFDKDWTSKTADFHRELVNTIIKEDQVMIRIPFEHAKSTWVSIVFPLWNICRDIDTSILLLASTPTLVKKFLSVIKRHIEENPLIHRDFPHVKPSSSQEKWSDTQIIVQRNNITKDPTVEVAGMGGSILGGRFKIIIGDDVSDRKNMNTRELRDKAADWWFEDVSSRLLDGGKIAYVGTLQHWDDLGCRLEDNGTYTSIIKQAVVDWDAKKTLWEERFPFERLMKIRKNIGAIRFNKVYQNNKEAIRGRKLKAEWLHYYDPDTVDRKKLRIFMSVDPAIGEKEENDFFAIAIGGWNPKINKIYLLKTWKGRLDFPSQIKKLKEVFYEERPERVFIENQAFQKSIPQQLGADDIEIAKHLAPEESMVTIKSKDERFEASTVMFENERVLILETEDDFIDQWTNWPKITHDDVLDAVVMLVTHIRGGGENECTGEVI